MLSKIKEILKFIKTNYKWFIVGLFAAFSLFLLIQNSCLRNRYNSDIVVVTDSLTTYKNKVNELYTAQTTYIASEKELKKINEELYNEVKNLKDNPLVVTKIETEYKIDTVSAETAEIDLDSLSNVCKYNWSYSDEWYKVGGTSNFNFSTNTGLTTINSTYFKSDLTLDVIENKDKNLEILVKSSNPYCDITSINGAIISPEKIKSVSSRVKNNNRWGLGIQLGGGIGINGQNIILTPYFGVGISYNIITF